MPWKMPETFTGRLLVKIIGKCRTYKEQDICDNIRKLNITLFCLMMMFAIESFTIST